MIDLTPVQLAAIRALVGDDWDKGVEYTDIGSRGDVMAIADRVLAAVRPLIAVEALRDAADLARLEADVAEWLLYKFGRMWLSDANKAADREVRWSEIKKMSRGYARDCMVYMEDLRATYPNGLVREDTDA